MNEDATTVDSLSELRDAVRVVIKGPAYEHWKRLVEAQFQQRQFDILEPCGTQDKLIEQEFVKGEIRGMMHAVMQWPQLLENLETEIQRAIKQQETDQ